MIKKIAILLMRLTLKWRLLRGTRNLNFYIGLLMPFHRTIFVISINTLIATNAQAQQNTPSEDDIISCPVPTFKQITETESDIELNAINIFSKSNNIAKGKFANFSGGVTLIKNEHSIKANEVQVNRETSTISAQGDIHFQNQGVDVFASQLNANESEKTTVLSDSYYQLANNPGHGSAALVSVSTDGTLVLQDSSFTTCYGKIGKIGFSGKNFIHKPLQHSFGFCFTKNNGRRNQNMT